MKAICTYDRDGSGHCRLRNTVCNIISIAFGLCIMLPAIWWTVDRSAAVQTISEMIDHDDTVHPGEEVTYFVTVKELRSGCSGLTIKRFIDSWGHISEYTERPSIVHDTKAGSVQTYNLPLYIPRGMAPGPSHYAPIIYRWCNPIQHYIWPMVDHRSVNFTVALPEAPENKAIGAN